MAGKHKHSVSARIRRAMKLYPNKAPFEIANIVGCRLNLVHNVRYLDKLKAAKLEADNTKATPAEPTGIVKGPYYKAYEDRQTPAARTSKGPDGVVAILAERGKRQGDPNSPAAVDMVNSPPHYLDGGIETIDYIRAKLTLEELAGYYKGNAIKYLSRAGKKGAATEDYQKAAWYLNQLREL